MRNPGLLILVFAIVYYMQYKEKKDAYNEQNGIKKTYRDDGSVYTEANYSDGLLHGVCITYHPNGKVFREENYVYNVLQGRTKQYYQNGVLYEECTYFGGKIEGTLKRYHKDGKLKAELPFKQGKECLGLKEYILNGDPRPYYPEIVVETDNQIQSTGTYTVKISMSERVQQAEYYVGELNDGCLQDSLLQIQPVGKDKGQIVYKVARGQILEDNLNVIAKVKTIAGNILVKQKRYRVSAEPSFF